MIDQVIPQAEAVSLRVRQFTMSTMFDADALPQLSFYLRNREAADAVAGSPRREMALANGGFRSWSAPDPLSRPELAPASA